MFQQNQLLFRALLDIGKELAAITDIDPLLQRILEVSQEVFTFDNAIIRLLNPATNTLETAASYGYSEDAISRPIGLGQGIMGKAAKFGRPYLINNIAPEDDYIPGIDAARSEMAVPLIARDKVIGVFNVESRQPDAFTAQDCDTLTILAGQAAIAIDNAHLYRDLCQVSREKEQLHHLNEQILTSISIGLYTVDQHLRITSWNPSMTRMSGISAAEAGGKSLLELFPTLEEEGIAERLRDVLSSGEAQQLRIVHRGQSGQNRLQNRFLSPLKDDNETVGAVIVVEDITEFEQLLAQTIQSEKLVEVGRMSAGIAHEINNPLAVISYACQILEETETPSEQGRELLERIGLEVERLSHLTSELLTYSGRQEDHRAPTDLNQTIEDVLILLTYEIKKHQVDIIKSFKELPLVDVDGNKFKQIFINLVLNAIQAMEPHGTIHISTHSTSDQLQVNIADTGPGIPDHLKEQIFEPFITHRKDGTGTGLGLYLCRKIVTAYQGSLTVDDNLGGGSCFKLQLPR
ncbi:ATP-binding protein [Pelovirga terrestris]|uniref:histidine kinase n=1 Tax=Pelovirga terrestris TaxID=2771352 RepID=A0A8J6QK92_9BACT|nr:GAF domain-containing protein [Pelovirga terrestris]MBD1399709.1 GAF domain-containing protein [Pelovirga terrestris]